MTEASTATEVAPYEKRAASVVLITALMGTGKTTTGDYLAEYCGMHDLDGDNILHHGVTDRPEWEQAAGDITKALYEHWLKGEPAPEALWHPYVDTLCVQMQEALQRHGRIVVSWAIYRREVRDFLRQRMNCRLQFIRLDCETDVLVQGALARLQEGLDMSKMSTADWWASEDPAMQNCGGRKKYGEFSFKSFKQMQLENALHGMVAFGDDEPDALAVDVTSRDSSAFHRVSAALGLPPASEEVDIAKVTPALKPKTFARSTAAEPWV